MSKENKTDFNQQKRKKMTHFMLKKSFRIPTIERSRQMIQVRKFMAKK